MKLQTLCKDLVDAEEIEPLEITGLAYDSRQVKPSYLFAALSGAHHNGHDYIADAITQGASVVLGSEPINDLSVPYIKVAAPRNILAQLAARFYGDPTLQIPLIGITGTNGKTTCTYLIESILSAAGFSPAVLGTINYRYQDSVLPAPHTTPEAVDLQRWLAQTQANGANAFVMETSSHGIAMDRVRGCHFDVGVFTNLSQDHLDFHETLEDYFSTKALLFSELLPSSQKPNTLAVLNWDDPYAHRLAEQISYPIARCGWDGDLEYSVLSEAFDADGIRATIKTPDGPLALESPLIGRFNLTNILLSVAACHGLGVSIEAISAGIAALSGIPGRLERVPNQKDLKIFVDYAHTPDALHNVLEAVRSFTKGRLITVFGCGGNRDTDKRPLMGLAVARLSDVLVLTSDNPRKEDPMSIIDQILPGLRAEKIPTYEIRGRRGFIIEADRRQAIRKAIALAKPGDLVLIAGKGHEDYQIIGTEKNPFSDLLEAQNACEALG